MKKGVLALLIIAMALAAAFYLHRLSVVGDQLARAADTLSSYGRLSWESVWIDPRGRATVRRLEFQPTGASDPVRADSLVLINGDLSALTALRSRPRQSTDRQQWSFYLRGLRLPIATQMASWRLDVLGLILPFRADACAGLEDVTLGDLLALDYGRLEVDLDVSATIEGEHAEFDFQAAARGLAETSQRWQLDQFSWLRQWNGTSIPLDKGRLVAVDYRLRDLGLLRRIDQACQPPEDGRDRLRARQFRAWLRGWSDLGLEPNGIAQAAFQHYLQNPGSAVSLRLRPAEELPLADVTQAFDRDLIQRLEMSYALDDGPFVDLELNEVPSTAIEAPPSSEEEEAQTTGILRSEDKQERTIVVGRPPGWVSVPLEALDQHLGDLIRIDFVDGTQLTGRLEGLGEDQLDLQTQNRMGQFIRPVPLAEITAIEVRP
jgi:hypothetical protein